MLDATFTRALLHIVAESAPYLVLGFVAAGLLRALIPRERVRALLGTEGWRSVLRASLIGVPLPLCSCSVIPAATGLRRSGAGRAATTSFLISTPETGVDSVSLTYALMDPLMTVARPVAAFVTAVLTGGVVGALPTPEGATPPPDADEAIDDCCASPEGGASTPAARGTVDDGCAPPEGTVPAPGPDEAVDDCCAPSESAAQPEAEPPQRTTAIIDGLRYAFGPLFDDLALWLVGGFVLAAAVGTIIPEGFFAAFSGGWLSSLVMMLLATPVYICASAATPVAAAMVMKGLDPGAAMVFLLVGPATNVTTMLVVLRFLGRRVLIAYLVGVTACALAFGAAINSVYAAWSMTPSFAVSGEEAMTVTVLQLTAMAFLGALVARRAWRWVSARPARSSEAGLSGVVR